VSFNKKNKCIGSFCSKEPTVTGDTFLAVMENTALRHVPVGTVLQSDGAPCHFSRHVRAFLDREFPDHWVEREASIPCLPRSPGLIPLEFSSGDF
jgi:hypothetical protein